MIELLICVTLYEFDGANYRHWTGWFDHAITHHIVIDLPTEDRSDG